MRTYTPLFIFSLLAILCIGLVAFFLSEKRDTNTTQNPQENAENNDAENETLRPSFPESEETIEVVLENLSIPWDVAFLPEGGMLISERAGTLLYIQKDFERTEIPLPSVRHIGEGGLLGITLHPRFADNRFLYLYLTQESGDGLINRVERHIFRENGILEKESVIIDNIPGARYHDGGRIEFGPDGMLYITTGDATVGSLSQNKNSLAGKTLRLMDDGAIPENNPFGTAMYSYGHRNAQGLAWDSEGRLFSTEHGRSGIASGLDEINHIEKGKNYGWPTIEGDMARTGMEAPTLHSGARETWAPASALYYDGSLFFAGLRGETLYEAVLVGEEVVELKRHLVGEYGRLRTVRLSPDGFFYLTTSNRDGRGTPQQGDDKLIRINPRMFREGE